MLKLGNNLWHELQLITTKNCSQNLFKWKAKSVSHVETCIYSTSHFFSLIDDQRVSNERWAKNVWREDISTPIYMKCNNMRRLKICIHEFWCILYDLDVPLEQRGNGNENPAHQNSVQNLTIYIQCIAEAKEFHSHNLNLSQMQICSDSSNFWT